MGLTINSTGNSARNEILEIKKNLENDIIIALAGNPNVGKSTVFNALTGLNQHTGNWPGKTVTNAQGSYDYKDDSYILVDLPGTYSLFPNSVEEQVARDFICFGNPDVTVIVADATCLERNLNLTLQILEITDKAVLCVNLLDEAKRKKIKIDLKKLSSLLGIPVVGAAAREKKGLDDLKEAIRKVANNKIETNAVKVEYDDKLQDLISQLTPHIKMNDCLLNKNWVALKLIENDEALINSLKQHNKFSLSENKILEDNLNILHSGLTLENIAPEDISDKIVSNIVKTAECISGETVYFENRTYNSTDRKIDKILTSRFLGIPIMIVLLGVIFWITIVGANYPSALLADFLYLIEQRLSEFFIFLSAPKWIHDVIVLGIYKTLAWVISVMLPPMTIFFPIFTFLEDLGYLPRIAFNLDHFFKKACAHGKQALTMAMGFGCNAAGVIGCRIIDSKRERLIAIITNNFVPCNGRFPTLISLSGIVVLSILETQNSFFATLLVLAAIVSGVAITLFVSKLLSKTILKGLPSSFSLELPPYRKPQVGRIIVSSIFDRTLFVLLRAVVVAAPAGLVLWIMANVTVYDISLLAHCATFLDPFGRLLGMDGYIIMAFILGFPANEIVIPIIIMGYMSKGSLLEIDGISQLGRLFADNGWTFVTGLCTMVFSLNHWPCSTTLLTIKKETQSIKWTFISFIVPTIIGIVLCFIIAQVSRLFGFI